MPAKVYYNGSDTEYYYRFDGTHIYLDASHVVVDADGTYDIVSVLTTRENGERVVLLDTLEPAYVRTYYGLIIPDSVDTNGKTHKYSAKGTGGKLVITVSSVEE